MGEGGEEEVGNRKRGRRGRMGSRRRRRGKRGMRGEKVGGRTGREEGRKGG